MWAILCWKMALTYTRPMTRDINFLGGAMRHFWLHSTSRKNDFATTVERRDKRRWKLSTLSFRSGENLASLPTPTFDDDGDGGDALERKEPPAKLSAFDEKVINHRVFEVRESTSKAPAASVTISTSTTTRTPSASATRIISATTTTSTTT